MTRTEHELLTILSRAHAALDRRGVMPARLREPWVAPGVCPTCGRMTPEVAPYGCSGSLQLQETNKRAGSMDSHTHLPGSTTDTGGPHE